MRRMMAKTEKSENQSASDVFQRFSAELGSVNVCPQGCVGFGGELRRRLG